MPTTPRAARGGLSDLLGLAGVLRRKLRVAIATLGLTWLLAYHFAEDIALVLARPLDQAWARRSGTDDLGASILHFGSLIEPFWTYLHLAFWCAILASSPVLFFQLWRAIAPRLEPAKRRLGIPFATVTALCFVGGVVFGYFLVLPAAFDFFLSYTAKNLAAMHGAFGLETEAFAVRPTLFIGAYLSVTTHMLIGFGLAFELPVVLSLFAWLGLIGHKAMWRFNRYAIVLCFVVGALLTPGPDILSMLMMSLPLVVLYNVAIAIAWLIDRSRQRQRSSQVSR